jgi:hypothetical protein
LTRSEAETLLEELAKRSKDLYDMAALSLYSGVRAGELFTLTWSCVDLENDAVTLLDVHAVNNGPSVWDNGPITGGNYWSGYDCTGNPSDGTAPYTAEGITDAYPFQYPYGWELGDINDDDTVDLAVMGGGTGDGGLRPDYPGAHADVDDDGAVGYPDVLYILQAVVSFR